MSLSKSQRAVVREMFGGFCAYCGQPLGSKWHADHVEPVMRETKYVSGKRGPCNIDKACVDIETWRRLLRDKVNVALRASNPLRHAQRFGLLQIIDAPIVFHFEKFGAGRKEAK